MEERYGQLEIDAGNVKRVELVQDQQEREKRTYQKNPYTYQIDEQLLRKEDEDEGDLVSPNQEIFKSISDKITEVILKPRLFYVIFLVIVYKKF